MISKYDSVKIVVADEKIAAEVESCRSQEVTETDRHTETGNDLTQPGRVEKNSYPPRTPTNWIYIITAVYLQSRIVMINKISRFHLIKTLLICASNP